MEGQKNITHQKLKKSEKIKIFTLYFFMFAGGLWNLLDLFTSAMNNLAAPVMAFLGIYISWRIYKINDEKQKAAFLFILFIFVFTWITELIGVKTGIIFGNYIYGEILYPQIFNTPLVIGFAWITAFFSSIALMQSLSYFNDAPVWLKVIVTGLFMVLFDSIMEPAAQKLTYWIWTEWTIPIKNYVTWFIVGSILAFTGYKSGVLNKKLPAIILHVYFAQLLYFLMVYFN